jgi:hypothetical protein
VLRRLAFAAVRSLGSGGAEDASGVWNFAKKPFDLALILYCIQGGPYATEIAFILFAENPLCYKIFVHQEDEIPKS